MKLQNFAKIQIFLNSDQKCFSGGILNNYLIFEIKALKFVKLKTFKKKQKGINLRPNMPYLSTFWWNFKKVLSYLKTAPSNLSNSKPFRKKKQKYLNMGPKMPYLGIFGVKF